MKSSLHNPYNAWLALAIISLAFGLRIYAIDSQSLWADEGTSLALALRSPGQILADTAQDVHPPLYYLMLHGWIRLFGEGVASVRGLSVLLGTLTVLIVMVLGARWFGAGAGLAAGLVAACSPLAIYYSQETRMYALAMLCAACAWLLFDAWLRDPRPLRLVGYLAAITAGLGAHFFMAAIVLALNLVWLIVAVRRKTLRSRATFVWLGVNALPALLYLPLVWRNRALLGNWSEIARDSFGPAYVAEDTLRSFTQGLYAAGWSPWMLLALGLVLFGLVRRAPHEPGRVLDGRLAAGIWLLAPVVIMALLAFNRPYYQPRFLLPALPAFQLLIGWGARFLAPALLLPALIGSAWQPLMDMWHNPANRRDDLRGMAHDIAAIAGPNDAVMALGQSQLDTLLYYDRRLPQPYLIPRVRPLDEAATIRDLEGIAEQHRRLYALFYVPYEADPRGVIRGWLDANAFRAGSRWYGGVELAIYEFGEPFTAGTPTHLRYTGDLRLERLTRMPASVHPGEAVRITLAWLPNAPLDRPLNLFLHLVDNNDQIVAQFDGPPTHMPMPAWPVGVEQIGRTAIVVPPGTPPGDYRILIGLYDPVSGERVPLLHGGERFTVLTGVEVR